MFMQLYFLLSVLSYVVPSADKNVVIEMFMFGKRIYNVFF